MTWSRYGQDLQLQRVWCGWTCIQALLAGAAHMSAPYMVLDGCAPSAAYPFLPPPRPRPASLPPPRTDGCGSFDRDKNRSTD
jgi:hypothetical protein